MKYKAIRREKTFELTITDYPDDTAFYIDAMEIGNITHLIVTANARVKRVRFTYENGESVKKSEKHYVIKTK